VATYAYKAMNPGGRLVFGRMDAVNLIDLEMRLKRMDLDFITGDVQQQRSLFSGERVSRRELINFCFHLEQLTRAGVPILDGLTDLRDSLTNPRFREVIAGMIESIEGGRTLSQAMDEHPKVFDQVFASLIRAGEGSGNLPDVLKNLVDTLKWQDELAAHTKKLMTYPAFLGAVVLAVTFFMMIYLVPKMAGFITNMGHELPWNTKLLMATSYAFVHFWYLIVGIPAVAVLVLQFLIRTNPAARRRFDAAKLSLPVVGAIQRKIILSRFAGVFAMLYSSGISILDSIRATETVVGNQVIREGLQEIGRMIAEGQQITVAFQNVGLFPPLVIRMLRVGENTGALDVALTNVGYFYTRDVRESIERAQAMIEPTMTLIVGLLLGWIMLSVLGPIYDVITKLKF
jgi:type IV pilus assembly protein PilC